MPPPLNEICDSEDEDDLLSPIAKADHRVATASRGEVVPADLELANEASAEHERSTGSTGEQLRQAHLDLMAPTQDIPDTIHVGSVNVNAVSPSLTRTKRRLTGTDATPPPSSASASRKVKRVKTSPPFSSQPLSNETIPGATIPGATIPGATNPSYHGNATSDTIASESILADNTSIDCHHQTPSAQVHRKASQQETPPEDMSSSLTPWSVSAVGNSSALAPTAQHNSNDSPHSDDHLIDLPVENYKPRPSRSRSERVVLEVPVDFSKRPEKTAKASRARTIAHSPVKPGSQDETTGPRIFPDRPILQAPDYEPLSPPLPDVGNLASIPDVLHLDDTLPPQTIAETSASNAPPSKPLTKKEQRAAKTAATKAAKAAEKATPKRGRGRPKKNLEPDAQVDEADELGNDFHRDIQTSDRQQQRQEVLGEVQVVITPREHDSPGLAETAAEQPPDVMSILDALNEKYPLKPAVSGAEHPGNDPVVVNKEADKQVEVKGVEIEIGAYDGKENEEEEVVAKAASNINQKAKPTKAVAGKAFKLPSVSASASSTPSKAEAKHLGAPEKSAEQSTPVLSAKSSLAKSSPMAGRSPMYRVGLSKTQRTQSLLKVFRK